MIKQNLLSNVHKENLYLISHLHKRNTLQKTRKKINSPLEFLKGKIIRGFKGTPKNVTAIEFFE